MCGLNGIFAYHDAANPPSKDELLKTRDQMTARGPDGAGAWWSQDGRIGFGHRRLSIIDLSERARQPMASPDGSLVVTFNGEIYNFRELRRGLEAKGHRFLSDSDTEVLIHLYKEKGEQMLHDLRGMFAFAIWDAEQRRLFIARDPYGIKPLYYANDGRVFRFASQVKALLAGGQISRAPDPAGLAGFYLWGSVPEPLTTWRAIRALPAGASMTIDSRGARDPVPYHSIAEVYVAAEALAERPVSPATDHAEALTAALRDSVRHHLIADVPVGAFLSAGIDSGALVGLMRDAGQDDIRTVTLSFAEFAGRPEDEAPTAARVARRYGAKHTNRVVSEDEFRQDLPKIFAAMDQPSIDGVNTWFVAKAARELGLKVAISGLGGDELFGGYPSFRDVPRMAALLKMPAALPGLARAWRRFAGAYCRARPATHPKLAALLELGGTVAGAYLLRRGLFMPAELAGLLDAETLREGLAELAPVEMIAAALCPGPTTDFAKVATLESTFYMRNQLLRDADWASMAHSLEIRVPLVDACLLKQIAPCLVNARHRPAKAPLARVPAKPLPEDITQRQKTGFSTPVATWLQRMPAEASKLSLPPALAGPNPAWARRWACYVGGLMAG